jgi:hypothetical protein
MIDISLEKPLPLPEAAKGLPGRKSKPLNVATLYRWSMHGCRGVLLETIQIGSQRCTSTEALQRFFDAITAKGPRPQSVTSLATARTTRIRQRQIERAQRELAQAGL